MAHSTKAQPVKIGKATYASKNAACRALIKMGRGKTAFSVIAEKVGVGIPVVSVEYKKMVLAGVIKDVYKNRRGFARQFGTSSIED